MGARSRKPIATTFLLSATVVCFLSACGSSTASGPSKKMVIQAKVVNGQVQSAQHEYDIPLDSKVTIRVTSDVADEVHVHGYDLMKDVKAGGTAVISFKADIQGSFIVELESRGLPLFQFRVS